MTYSTFVVVKNNGERFEVEAVHHKHAYQIAMRHCKSEEIQNIYAKEVTK